MFRFTIRELMLLTLVVAMGVGWWIDRRSHEQQLISSFEAGARFAASSDARSTLIGDR